MYFINNYYHRIRFHLLKILLNTLQAIKYLFIQCIRQLYLYIYRLNMSILFWCLTCQTFNNRPRTIDKIAFGIPNEVSLKSLGTYLLGSHLQYSRLCYIRSVLLDLYNLCIVNHQYSVPTIYQRVSRTSIFE